MISNTVQHRPVSTRHFAILLLVAAGACGSQASEEYLGAPLLRMQGHVSVDALNAASQSVPALCFPEVQLDKKFRLDRLPDDLQLTFDGFDVAGGGGVAHVVAAETRGKFPAEFDIEIFEPPPAAATLAAFPGEPRAAFGQVCAVESGHAETEQALINVSTLETHADDLNACNGAYLRSAWDGSHYYARTFYCPTHGLPLSECQLTAKGDSQLLASGGDYDNVFGVDENVQVIYLAEPARAGSYTAYLAGAPEGLDAGYHVRGARRGAVVGAPAGCSASWELEALDEVNAKLGMHYDSLPTYWDEQGEQHLAPADVIATYNEASARHEMQDCPLEYIAFGPADPTSLSIDLHSNEPAWWNEPPCP